MKSHLTAACGIASVCLSVTVAHAQFSDVQSTRPDAEAITHVFSRGIVNGYPDGTFRPDGFINRAEFAKIAILFFWDGEARYPEMCASVHFDDVPRDAWYFHYVCSAKDQGIVEGYPGTRRYAPEQTISVVEAIKMITKAFKMDTGAGAGPWYAPYVHSLADRYALPPSLPTIDQPITRGEVAEIFYRLDTNTLDKPSLTYAQLTGEAETSFDPCTASPEEGGIGRVQNPVAEEYEDMPQLGPLFTASDCGSTRLQSLYGDLSSTLNDVRLVLKDGPSLAFYNELYAIGFAPTDGNSAIESRKWVLTGNATYLQLLQLKPYADEIDYDDCTNCG